MSLKIILHGNEARSKALLKEAKKRLVKLKESMSFQNLKQLYPATRYLPDGSSIRVGSVFGIDSIEIVGAGISYIPTIEEPVETVFIIFLCYDDAGSNVWVAWSIEYKDSIFTLTAIEFTDLGNFLIRYTSTDLTAPSIVKSNLAKTEHTYIQETGDGPYVKDAIGIVYDKEVPGYLGWRPGTSRVYGEDDLWGAGAEYDLAGGDTIVCTSRSGGYWFEGDWYESLYLALNSGVYRIKYKLNGIWIDGPIVPIHIWNSTWNYAVLSHTGSLIELIYDPTGPGLVYNNQLVFLYQYWCAGGGLYATIPYSLVIGSNIRSSYNLMFDSKFIADFGYYSHYTESNYRWQPGYPGCFPPPRGSDATCFNTKSTSQNAVGKFQVMDYVDDNVNKTSIIFYEGYRPGYYKRDTVDVPSGGTISGYQIVNTTQYSYSMAYRLNDSEFTVVDLFEVWLGGTFYTFVAYNTYAETITTQGQRITNVTCNLTENYIIYSYIVEDFDSYTGTDYPDDAVFTFNRRIIGMISIIDGVRQEEEVDAALLGSYSDTYDPESRGAIGSHGIEEE